MSVREIFEELMTEALNGTIYIGDESYDIGFNVRFEERDYISDINNPTINIEDKILFYDALSKYIDKKIEINGLETENEKEDIKRMMTSLFVKMNSIELEDPANYITLKTNNLIDTYIQDDDFTEKAKTM